MAEFAFVNYASHLEHCRNALGAVLPALGRLSVKTTTQSVLRGVAAFFFSIGVTLSTAHATVLTYSFTATATSGQLTGTAANGTFSFDDVIIPPGPLPVFTPSTGGVGVIQTGLLTGLDFTWNGIKYDETTANTGFFVFYQGPVFFACFGNNVDPGACGAGEDSKDWFVLLFPTGIGHLTYGVPGDFEVGSGSVAYSAAAAPEPSTLALLGVGLVIVMRASWRKQRDPLTRS